MAAEHSLSYGYRLLGIGFIVDVEVGFYQFVGKGVVQYLADNVFVGNTDLLALLVGEYGQPQANILDQACDAFDRNGIAHDKGTGDNNGHPAA